MQASARQRNIGFFLDKESAYSLLECCCVYCGSNTSISIDRLNNEGPYSRENTASCCKDCNYMKWTWNVCDFIQACCNVANPHRGIYHRFEPTRDHKGSSYYQYQASSKKRGLEFSISKEEFDRETTAGRCHYCFRPSSTEYHLGIDRVSNIGGYSRNNIVSCCARCNRMKSCKTRSEFISLCTNIYNKCGHILNYFFASGKNHSS